MTIAIGSIWTHRNGTSYTVTGFRNEPEGFGISRLGHPVMVDYVNTSTRKPYGRALSDWHRSMTDTGDVDPSCDDANRYVKLRKLMTYNLPATGERVCRIASLGCWMSWDDFDKALDADSGET